MSRVCAPWWRLAGRSLRAGLAALALSPLAGAFAAPPAADPVTCPPEARMPGPDEIRALQRKAQDRGLLWRIEHRGRTSWLYGTMHAAKLGWSVPGPTVADALRASDSLALELNILDPDVMKVLFAGMQARPDAPPLRGDLQRRLEEQRRLACAGPELAVLRPDAQVITLLSLAGRSEGLDAAYGIDFSLAGMARALDKPVLSLETPELQLRELVSDDPARVAETVASGLRQLESGTASQKLGLIAGVWADGRIHLLESLPDWCDCMANAAERADYDRMVYGRNPGLAREVARQIRSGRSVFAAVGALHMVGTRGLPALLAAQGFKVQRVEFPAASPP